MINKKPQGRLWSSTCATCVRHRLSPSLPAKLADGLGLKDTPLAWRDAPRSFGSSALLASSRRLGRQGPIRLYSDYTTSPLTCQVGPESSIHAQIFLRTKRAPMCASSRNPMPLSRRVITMTHCARFGRGGPIIAALRSPATLQSRPASRANRPARRSETRPPP